MKALQIIKQWIEDNRLMVEWTDDITFIAGDKKYICLEFKQGKIFNDQFDLLVNEMESETCLMTDDPYDYYCFAFGNKVYYSPCTSNKPRLNLLKYIGRSDQTITMPYLGVHGGYELCNGSRRYDDWCKKANWLEVKYLGICERNTLAGVLKFQMACKKNGIIPIIGESVVVRFNQEKFTVKLFVKNNTGWQNLLMINAIINVESGLDKCIELEELTQLCDGLIMVLGEVTLNTDIIIALGNVEQLLFQLDPFQYKSSDRDVKKLEAYKVYFDTYRSRIDPIVICDSYYLDQEDAKVKKLLNQIGNIGFEHQSEDQYFKSVDEILEQFDAMLSTHKDVDTIIDTAIHNTLGIVQDIKFEVEVGNLKLPQYKMTELESKSYDNNLDLLWGLINDGLHKKVIGRDDKDLDAFLARIEKEIKVIQKGGVVDYFLTLADIINWCKNNEVLTGIGRGCFLPECKVVTTRGELKIEEVQIGDHIIGAQKQFDEVVDCFKYYVEEDLIRIELEDGRIMSCTEDHEILTVNRGYVRAIDLTETDDLMELDEGLKSSIFTS